MGNTKSYTAKLNEKNLQELKRLSEITRVPSTRYMDEALEDLLKKYAGVLKK